MEQQRWGERAYPQPVTRRKPLDERTVDRVRLLATLTRREHEVLGKISLGMTDREIAAQLFIERITVSNHVANILRKLDVPNRAAAAALAAASRAAIADRGEPAA